MKISGLGCLAALCFNPVAAAPLTIPYQLTHSLNMDPSPNPDGKRLVFISVIAGHQLHRKGLRHRLRNSGLQATTVIAGRGGRRKRQFSALDGL
jgi:hypothetical protein